MDGKYPVSDEGMRRWLDEAAILGETVQQLRKDLDLPDLETPPTGKEAFENVRGQVAPVLERWLGTDRASLSKAINRVDLTETMVSIAVERGGTHELAGMMVLRCLQKALLRRRFSSRA